MDTLLPALPQLGTPARSRRSFRLLRSGVQLRLAGYVLATGFGFALLFVGNSWAAYGSLFDASLSISAPALTQEIQAQTRSYLHVSLVLVASYTLAVLAITIAYLHRVLGPIVALERHVQALERGDYSSRLSLRDDALLFRGLAKRLNRLASHLDHSPLHAAGRTHR